MGLPELHDAARCGDVKEVRRLLKNKQCDVNEEDESGCTPLWCAAVNNRIETAEILVNHNADVNKGDPTPLHAAVFYSQVGTVKWLLEHGGDPNRQDNYGGSILHTAAEDNNTEIVKLLLTYGADPNIKDEDGDTVFDWVQDKDSTIYQILIKFSQNAWTTLEAGIGDIMDSYFRQGIIADSGPVYLSCKVTPGQDNTKTKVENIQISGTALGCFIGGPSRRKPEESSAILEKFNASLQIATQSVGVIMAPQPIGTGFRVGDCYLMTCWHVVDAMMPPHPLTGQKSVNSLSQAGVYVTFDYRDPVPVQLQQQPIQQYKFDQQNPLVWYSTDLDVAILKLDTTGSAVPNVHLVPKLKLTGLRNGAKEIHFVGHPDGRARTHDYCCPLKKQSANEIQSLYQFSMTNYGQNVYLGIDHPGKVIYDLSYHVAAGGASGSPGFLEGPNQEAEVVAMHCFAYPNVTLPLAQVHIDKTFEQGVTMKAVYDNLKLNPQFQRLHKNVF